MFMILNQLLSLLTRKLLYSVGKSRFVVIVYFVFEFLRLSEKILILLPLEIQYESDSGIQARTE